MINKINDETSLGPLVPLIADLDSCCSKEPLLKFFSFHCEGEYGNSNRDKHNDSGSFRSSFHSLFHRDFFFLFPFFNFRRALIGSLIDSLIHFESVLEFVWLTINVIFNRKVILTSSMLLSMIELVN